MKIARNFTHSLLLALNTFAKMRWNFKLTNKKNNNKTNNKNQKKKLKNNNKNQQKNEVEFQIDKKVEFQIDKKAAPWFSRLIHSDLKPENIVLQKAGKTNLKVPTTPSFWFLSPSSKKSPSS